MAAAAILVFSKIQYFNDLSYVGANCIIVPNFIKSVKRLRIWRFNGFFQNGGHPPSWICRAHTGTSHEDYLVVFIVVLNLVGIAAVFSII